MSSNVTHRTTCRICSQSNLVKILDLGMTPLANAFLQKEELAKPEATFPLALYFCQDCGLAQLLDVVNSDLLFSHYYYLTSTSKPLVDHFIELGDTIVDRFIDSKNELVVEIGGNDAVLLEHINDQARVLNIEPAKNIAQCSREKGVDTLEQFFNADLAKEILAEYGAAKVIVASNVFAHVDDLEDMLSGIKALLREDGVFVVEVHWVANLLGQVGIGGFDQIYHEHLSYFSLAALKTLVHSMSLKIFDVNVVPIHGYSLQVYICQNNNYQTNPSVQELLQQEKELRLGELKTYQNFSEDVEKNKDELTKYLLELKRQKRTIVGYGAPAKANTLLNYFDIGNSILDFVIDDSSLKQGCYTPGTHIPIFSRNALREKKPDDILLLAWNYAESILEREQDLRNKGVSFIIPIPKVTIISP